jgi:hypothetical protein
VTDVFISSAREDRAFAGRLAEASGARGIKIWRDRDLIGRDNDRARIRGRSERDARAGIAKIPIFDSCRDNPFKMDFVTR